MVAEGVHPLKGGKHNHGGDIGFLLEEALSLGSWRTHQQVNVVRVEKAKLSLFYNSGLGVLPESQGVNMEPAALLSHSVSM